MTRERADALDAAVDVLTRQQGGKIPSMNLVYRTVRGKRSEVLAYLA